jgi:hypothetical protein
MQCLARPAAAGLCAAAASRRAQQVALRRARCAAAGPGAPGAAGAVPASSAPSSAAPAPAAAPEPIFYSAYPLDRAAELRADAGKLEQLLRHPRARLLPVSGSRALFVPAQRPAGSGDGGDGNGAGCGDGGAALAPAWVSPAAEAGAALDARVPPLFLGLDASGAPSFAGQVARDAADAVAAGLPCSRWGAGRGCSRAARPAPAACARVGSRPSSVRRRRLTSPPPAPPRRPQGGLSRAPRGRRCAPATRRLLPPPAASRSGTWRRCTRGPAARRRAARRAASRAWCPRLAGGALAQWGCGRTFCTRPLVLL